MSGVYVIFDYFKEAFHINKDNKVLYKPQIVLIFLRSLVILFIGAYLYGLITKPDNLKAIRNEDFSFLYSGIGIFVGVLIILVILLGILSMVVEAGLLNMYKAGVLNGNVSMNNFWEGVSKYFFKLIAGYLLIIVGTFAFILGFIIVSIFTLGIGFFIVIIFSALIMLAIQLFLSMWKVSLVMDESGLVDAFKDSFKFVKNNLWPILVLQIIHWSFSGSSKGIVSNFNNLPSSNSKNGGGNGILPGEGRDMIPNKDEIINKAADAMKIGVAIAVPTITVITAIATLISMIFEVFFNLSLFIAYKSQFTQPINPEEEVSL